MIGKDMSLRVLVVSNYFIPTYQGGAEVASYNSARGLQDAGHQVRVLSINTRLRTARNGEYAHDGIPVHEVHLPRRAGNPYLQAFDPLVAAYVNDEIARLRPDVIHTQNVSGTSLAPFAVAAWRKIPLVATLHDHWLLCANNMLMRKDGGVCDRQCCSYRDCFSQYDFWATIRGRRSLFRRLTGHVHTFISPSQSLIDLHVARGYDAARFALVRYGMYPLTRPTDDEAGIGAYHRGANTMVFVGAIVLSKGIQVVMQALPRLIDEIPDFRLLVAGWGPPELQSELGKFGDRVVLLGKVSRSAISEVFAGAGLTIMPSIYNDNSPLAVHESLMCGTPVLAATSGGIPELVEDGITGYWYNGHDAQELADKTIAHFRRSARDRRAMRRACVQYASREFSIERHTARVVEVYRSAIAAETVARGRAPAIAEDRAGRGS